MDLLIRGIGAVARSGVSYLHSIMYLLIQSPGFPIRALMRLFTFHNVSINSICSSFSISLRFDLHSIMYLLIHLQRYNTYQAIYLFTFHNVSINSKERKLTWEEY